MSNQLGRIVSRVVLAIALSIAALLVGPGAMVAGGCERGPDPRTDAQPGVPPPETPVGKVLAHVLDAFADDARPLDPATMNDAFKKAVPQEQLAATMRGFRAQYGALKLARIEGGATDSALRALCRAGNDNSPWRLSVSLDAAGLIAGLLISPAGEEDVPALASWEDLDGLLKGLGPGVSFAVYEHPTGAPGKDGSGLTPVHLFQADKRLAIGSTFKLYVLGALGELVAAGGARWEELLAIRDDWKSLPSGVMQNETAGTGFPISQYAAKMISISDNTAADHLLRRVGRERVEQYLSRLHGPIALDRPFLSTREMFAIKLSPDRTLAGRFAGADEAARRAMLADDGEVAKAAPDLSLATHWNTPTEIERVEWFASAAECCKVMSDLYTRGRQDGMKPMDDALRMNPGVPLDKKVWPEVRYKGGSEPGVLNLTWMLTRAVEEKEHDGAGGSARPARVFALSFGWNDPAKPVEEGRGVAIAQRAIEWLAKQP